MHRRPSGVTLSAVVLGVIDLFLLLCGLFYVVLAVLFASHPFIPPSAAGQPAPPPYLLTIMTGLIAGLTLLCALWGISTFVGLLRMRSWASVSIMIIGGCLILISLFQLFGCILAQLTLKNLVLPPNAGSANLVPPNPAALQGAFFFLEALCLCVAAIGVWWIVYFARQKTRDAFAQARLGAALTGTAQLNPAAPITDFSVAQPLQPAAPGVESQPVETAPATPERPISMTIVAALMFLSSVSLAFCCFIPYPQFMFGVQVSGAAEYALLLAMAVLYALAAYGLLRRIHFGWLLAVGMHMLGLLNLFTFVSPNVRQRYMDLLQTISKTSAPAMPDATQMSVFAFQQKLMGEMMMPVYVVCALFILFLLVLLWRARWWYTTTSKQ